MIGAGAAGIVAGRHLLGQGLRPTIYEAAKTLGGAWASSSAGSNNANSKMWHGLHTNLSKHTCRFSEFPWPESTPTFPSALEMEAYLESYSKHYLDPSCLQYQCQVTNIAPTTSSSETNTYRVEWTDLTDQTKHSKEFQSVVVATGFFSQPHYPSFVTKVTPDIVHSTDYQRHQDFANETVAVIGSSFSALEIAVDVSQSAKQVVHVLPNIPWVVPRMIPQTSTTEISGRVSTTTSSVLPVDLAFYRRRQPAPQLPESTQMTPESAKARHEWIQSMVGTQKQSNSPLGLPDTDAVPLVAISDDYLDLIIDGTIEVVHGRATDWSREDKGLQVTTQINSQAEPTQRYLSNITKLIC